MAVLYSVVTAFAATPERVPSLADFQAAFGARVPDATNASMPAYLPKETEAQGKAEGASVVGEDGCAALRGLARGFMSSAETQLLLGRRSGSSAVQQLQRAVKELSTELEVLKVPQVAAQDVFALISGVASDLQLPGSVPEFFAKWVEGKMGGRRAVSWDQLEYISCGEKGTVYYSLLMFYEPSKSPYVDLVVSSLDSSMRLERITVNSTSERGPDGRFSSKTTSSSSDLAGEDLRQFQVLFKFAAFEALLRELAGRPKAQASQAMRLMPLRLAAAQGEAVKGVFDTLVAIILEAAAHWQDIVSAFASHSSEKISILSQGGFQAFNQATVSYVLPGVHTADTEALFDTIMEDYEEATRRTTIKELKALLLAHGNDTAAWVRQHVVYGRNQSQGGCGLDRGCAEFFVAHVLPSAQGNHWAVCAYKSDFVLADSIELVTTASSRMGGLFTDEHDDIRHLPPTWTAEDEAKLQAFMGVQCQYALGLAMDVKGLKAPVFPPAADLSLVV